MALQPVVRPLGYSGYLQQLTWDQGDGVLYRAYLFGGGGGGGGNDSYANGGNGSGGGYTYVSGIINRNDVMQVAVGGGGGPGGSGSRTPGGTSGKSYIFESKAGDVPVATAQQIPRVPTANLPLVGQTGYIGTGFFTVTVDPNSNPVTSTASYYYIVQDGTITYIGNRPTSNMTAGTYRGSRESYCGVYGPYDDGDGGRDYTGIATVNAFDLLIQGGTSELAGYSSFAGGRGGHSGLSGGSGSGGGGGGATVLLLNNTVIAVAGGGGGGGGAGVFGPFYGGGNPTAPGPYGRAPYPLTAGQNGADKEGDGGGGGGGGGGWNGGNGGYLPVPAGDVSNYGGSFGDSTGSEPIPPNGRSSGGVGQPYYDTIGKSTVGKGGTGNDPGAGLIQEAGWPGMAIIEFFPYGVHVNQGGSYNGVNKTYIKDQGQWKEVKITWIKKDGTWYDCWGGRAPGFTLLKDNSKFGAISRWATDNYIPPPEPDTPSD